MRKATFLDNLKVCGITRQQDAVRCAALGFGAVGFVFHPASPRNITPQAARAIVDTLPSGMAAVGVFVDEPIETILAIAETAALTTIQLHGHETVETVTRLRTAGHHVVKIARSANEARVLIDTLPPKTSILLECGCGPLPGGNGAVWDWAEARNVGGPVGIAGGLTPENLREAAERSGAVACDVSSGVELAPGIKDPAALERLATAATSLRADRSAFWTSAPRDKEPSR